MHKLPYIFHTMQTSIKIEKASLQPSMNSSSSEPIEPMVPPMSKRLRPHPDQGQDQALVHCPRCDSAHTKFCYYNNYSLSQPRYFCKSCRRYWTKGGTLRNIPVGSVSRKNKKLSSISTIHHHHRRQQQPPPQPHYDKLAILPNSITPQISNPGSQAKFSSYPDYMFENLTIDFMEMGGGGGEYKGGDHFPAMLASGGYEVDRGNAHGLSPFGETMTYDNEHYEKMMNGDDVKPMLFGLERQDQTGCHSDIHGSGVGEMGHPGIYQVLGLYGQGL